MKFVATKYFLVFSFIVLILFTLNILYSNVKFIEQAYLFRPWIYLALLSTVARFFKLKHSLFEYFVIAYVIKILMSYILLGYNARPGLLMENNFDLLFLLFFWKTEMYVSKYSENKISPLMNFLSAVVLIMSQSRSALLGLILIIITLPTKLTQKVFAVIVVLFVIFVAFFLRPVSSLSDLDRYVWMIQLLEAASFDVRLLSFGHFPTNYIDPSLCDGLKSGDRSNFIGFYEHGCISSIFVSHVLRFIWDFGIIGLFSFYASLYLLTFYTTKSHSLAFFAVTVLLINGLSVSSISAGYGFIALSYMLARVNYFKK